MTAAIVGRAVADRRRGIVGYGVGLGLMILWVMGVYPSVESELTDYVDAMPDAMKSLFGMEEISSLAGFVHAEVFSLMGPIVFLALAITTGANAIAGEERDRILPVILATGIGRRNLLVSRFVALAVDLAALGAIVFASLLAGGVLAGGGIALADLAAATLQLVLLAVLFGTLALAVGAATGSKTEAAGVAVAVALGTYLVDALANVVSWLEPFQLFSPFHWYAPSNPLVAGVSPGGIALLVAVTLVLVVAGVVTFDRRDVGR